MRRISCLKHLHLGELQSELLLETGSFSVETLNDKIWPVQNPAFKENYLPRSSTMQSSLHGALSSASLDLRWVNHELSTSSLQAKPASLHRVTASHENGLISILYPVSTFRTLWTVLTVSPCLVQPRTCLCNSNYRRIFIILVRNRFFIHWSCFWLCFRRRWVESWFE